MKLLIALLLIFAVFALSVSAQTAAFTYQGRLTDAGAPANGTYEAQFALYDALNGGTQIGATQTEANVSVSNGVFTAQIDFGSSAFSGADRYLEIRVKKPADASFTTLNPRQKITSAPYAIRSLNATNVETTTAGNSVVSSINNEATNTTINSNRLPADLVRIKPVESQNSTASDGEVLLLALTGTVENGTGNPPQVTRFQLKHDGSFGVFKGETTFSDPLMRLNADGGFLARGDFDGDINGFGVPIEGSGTRMMWYPRKAAFRAGVINGTQWDAANIGLYSAAFGENTRASGDNGFAAGRYSVAAGSTTTAIGEGNTATGAASVALGYGAHTNSRQGSFVFSDRSGTLIFSNGSVDTTNSNLFRASVNHSFNVRASGGYYLYTNTANTTGLRISQLSTNNSVFFGSFVYTDRSSENSINPTAQNQTIFRSSGGFTIYSNSDATSGVTLAPGAGAWSALSDRDMKENFLPVNSRDVLQKVLKLPISTWNYKSQAASIRHIGAMAQDFQAAFAVGESDKMISTIDSDGVAFAAIQGLNEEMNERTTKLQAENEALRRQVEMQKKQFNALEERLKKLEQSTQQRRKTKGRK